jgi:hypothetical protein
MFIVMKDGPKKGEVQEMKYFVARDLIIAGRAEQYFFDSEPTQKEVKEAQAEPAQVEQKAESKKKKGKK